MNKRNEILFSLIGLWAFGLIIGANVGHYLPGESSFPAWVMLTIGVIGTIGVFSGLYKALR